MADNEPNPDQAEPGYQGTFAAFMKKPESPKAFREKLYGPIGSFLLHVVLLILLFSIVIGPSEVTEFREIQVTVVDPVQTKAIEEFKPPEPQKIPDDVEIPDVATPEDAIAVPGTSVADVPSAGTGGGGAGAGEGIGDGTGSGFGDGMEGLEDGLNFISDASGPLVFQGVYAGRGSAGRAAGLAQYSDGKGNLTEAAVLKALEWLKKHQQPDGSWHTARDQYNVAFTGLAVLTFLAHGETLTSDKYGETLQKGLRWLVDIQQANGLYTQNSYAHAIGAYAVSEGYALTQIPFLRESMEKAVEAIIKGQQDNGGWTYNYEHNGRRDTSVMGWQIQALKAASSAGCATSELRECMRKAAAAMKLQYYDTKNPGASPGKLEIAKLSSSSLGAAQDSVGMFTYAVSGSAKATGGGNPTMTAVGTLCLEFLGEGASAEAFGGRGYLRQIGCDWLKPSGWCLYGWYYTTQAIFQGQGVPGNKKGKEDWKAWNNMFAKAFVNNQNADGSWCSPAKGEDGGWILDQTGSVYGTALGALSLMVYYRILPSYQQH